MSRPDEGLIHAWLDGELDAAEAARVEALVKSDPEWSAAAAEARGLIAASARIVSSLDDVPAGVVPKRAPAAPSHVTTAASRRAPAWWAMRAAAAVVIVAGTAIIVSQSGGIDGLMVAKEKDAVAAVQAPAVQVPAVQASTELAPVVPAPATAPAASGARARSERDSGRQGALADAAVSLRQQIAQDRIGQQQPLAQSQLSQQSMGGAGAGAGAGPPLARTDAQRAPDSLQKKNEVAGANLQQIVTTATGSDERRATANRLLVAAPAVAKAAGEQELAGLSAKASAPVECYRESSGAIVFRVQRLSDSTATEVPAARTAAPGGAAASADMAMRARVLVFRVRGDSLFVPGANGAIRSAVKVSCPQP
jgi:hypothetical protein